MPSSASMVIVAHGTSAVLRMQESFTGELTSDKGLMKVEPRKRFQDDSLI